jgi:hypothetical protein
MQTIRITLRCNPADTDLDFGALDDVKLAVEDRVACALIELLGQLSIDGVEILDGSLPDGPTATQEAPEASPSRARRP